MNLSPSPPSCLPASQISLEVAPSQPAMEYYTEEEMVQFRKPRKKKKVRKRLKADDLIPLADERTSRDHASRYKFVYVSTRVVGRHACCLRQL